MDQDHQAVPMPGGEGYTDVTHIFRDAGQAMEPGSFIFMDGFKLQDAMSAIEIGEPRLDSGAVLKEESKSPFDLLTPLLPEEVCWILDQSLAYEMQWHAGNTLSQTVFTLLFVHGMDDFNPDLIPVEPPLMRDPCRPRELITVVLRAFIFGTLKCCDLAWRTLTRGAVSDGEDWHSEKCDVSLLEGVPESVIAKQLEDAIAWLQASSQIPMQWRDGLQARLRLRKALLELMHSNVQRKRSEFHALIVAARQQLQSIRSRPAPEPEPDAPARLAFDPYITRRLNSFAPLRIIKPSVHATWNAIEALLNGLYELSILAITTSIWTWEMAGYLRLWLQNPLRRIPWLRACTHILFFDGGRFLNQFQPAWLLDRFTYETLGISWGAFSRNLRAKWTSKDDPPLTEIERRLCGLMTSYIRSLWYNQPRCRRELAKSLLEWHAVYDVVVKMTCQLPPPSSSGTDALFQLPRAIVLWRCSILREIVLSGFQMELYNADEKTFAYWYTTQIIEEHVMILNSLMSVMPKGSPTYKEMEFQQKFLTALRLMCTAVFSVTIKMMSDSWQRIRLNYVRRYKWAFRAEYDNFQSVPPASPEYPKFLPACADMLKNKSYAPVAACKEANAIFLGLIESPGELASYWAEERIQLLVNLTHACEGLYALPETLKGLSGFDTSTLKWDPQVNPWFPRVIPTKSDGVADISEMMQVSM